jgi:hypothetical protein
MYTKPTPADPSMTTDEREVIDPDVEGAHADPRPGRAAVKSAETRQLTNHALAPSKSNKYPPTISTSNLGGRARWNLLSRYSGTRAMLPSRRL